MSDDPAGPPEPLPEPWRPLGERAKAPRPAGPEWTPLPDAPHIERHRDTGRLRTNLPLPKGTP